MVRHMTRRDGRSTVFRFATVVAGLMVLTGVGRAEQAKPSGPRGSQWWWGMALNSWSPKNAVVRLVGKRAVDCGQFGPEVTEAELAGAIACMQSAARDRRTAFTIRHFLGEKEQVVPGVFSLRWLADGLLAGTDGPLRRFDYQGFFLSVIYNTIPPPEPTVKQSWCSTPRPFRDSDGTVKFACAAASK